MWGKRIDRAVGGKKTRHVVHGDDGPVVARGVEVLFLHFCFKVKKRYPSKAP